MLKLAKRVERLGKERNLTQSQCRNDTGIHFGRIEQGKRDISYTTFIALCDYFEIQPREFFE